MGPGSILLRTKAAGRITTIPGIYLIAWMSIFGAVMTQSTKISLPMDTAFIKNISFLLTVVRHFIPIVCIQRTALLHLNLFLHLLVLEFLKRSEERRVGNECMYGWSVSH